MISKFKFSSKDAEDHSVVDKNWFCLRISQHLWVIGRPLNDAKGSALLLIAIHLRNIGEAKRK